MWFKSFSGGRLFVCLLLVEVCLAQEAPSLTLMPKEIRRNLGDPVYVSCNPSVPNPELITNMEWRNTRGEIIDEDDFGITTLKGIGGTNQLDLMISKLRKEDVGNYTCSAMYAGNQNLVTIIQIKYQVSIDFKDTETLQTPTLNSDAKIRCSVWSDPAPLIDWTKDGIPLNKNDRRYIQQNDGILIKNIQEDDEGVYRCRARVAALGQIDFRDIQVEVHVPPTITGPPRNTSGVERETASFQCIAKGKPTPTYSWVNKDAEVLNKKEGFYVDERTGELTVLDLRPDHTGTYKCKAQNNAGDAISEAYLRVLTKPKIEKLMNLTVHTGRDAELRCIVYGDPIPHVIFRKEVYPEPFHDEVNPDTRITVTQEMDDLGRRVGVLRIRNLERKDDGLYSCKGNSSGGEAEAWGHITVEFPPTFEDQTLTEFWSWEQQPVNLSCLATSIPNATVQWFVREDPIRENDPNMEVVSYGPNGILRINPRDGSYFDTYTCKATNTLGEAKFEVALKQVQKPGPVSSTQIDKLTATTVAWTIRDPLDDGGRPILGYTVQYRLEHTSWDKSEDQFWTKASDRSYVVEHLTPEARYVFRFAAKNDVGDGEWSGEKSVAMPKRSAPEEPLIYGTKYPNVKTIPYTDHYDIQWQVPLDNGEPIQFFQIIYYEVKESDGEWKKEKSQAQIEVPYPGPSNAKVENLKSDSFYKIELRAKNEIGFSTPGEAIIKTAYAPAQSVSTAGSSANVAVIVGIVILALLVILITIDVSFYFIKNVGLTATIIARLGLGVGEKDKEAMIEEGIKDSAKSEGNGKAKDGVDKNSSVEKEPTETTPMIEGDTDKEAIIKEETKGVEEVTVSKSTATTKDSAV